MPYVAVDEAKKALQGPTPLKSFDFVVYGSKGVNMLIDVKGRKHTGRSGRSLDNWVTEADVRDLGKWEGVFGEGFVGGFAFLYWCAVQPPDALFHDIFEFGSKWYAVLGVTVGEYRRYMRQRSAKWNTVHIAAEDWHRISRPLQEIL